jgi:hypothetical protein
MVGEPLQFGDLARCKTHESDETFPALLEVVAYFGDGGRNGKRRSFQITADEFFGRGGYGAPISGDQIINAINHLRKKA